MNFELTQFLVNASSQDANVRGPAEAQLNQLQEQNLSLYLSGLCTELANTQKPAPVRQLAGLLLKNCLSAKSEQRQRLLSQNWLMLPEDIRRSIREMILRTLADPIKDIRSTAALVVGKVASIEVPENLWPNVIEYLCQNIQASPDEVKEASFQALGFVCEECPEQLQSKSNLILTAIASGMHSGQQNNAVKYAATCALENSLEFASKNFEVERERNQIMQMVLEAAQSTDELVRVASYQCLVRIVNTYYDFMKPYMPVMFKMTGQAISTEKESVALQAIEFWSTIAEVEKNLYELKEEAGDKKPDKNVICFDFAKSALGSLIPLILNCLLKQSDEVDDETWTVAMAAGSNLLLTAQCVGDAIVPQVIAFVQANIKNKSWRNREAATFAFGCILDGPDKNSLVPLVSQAFPVILEYLKDESPLVKDTAAWTIGRICDLVPETINEELLPRLMQALVSALGDQPKIASHVCWAIHNLAEAVDPDEGTNTSPLSKYFEHLLTALLRAADRPDVDEDSLLASTYEAISVLIQHAARDVYPLIGQLVPTLIERLKKTFLMQGLTVQEREKQNEAQALLCGALQNVVQKLSEEQIKPFADSMMATFLQVLSSKNATVHEETFMAMGAVANKVGEDFLKYMQHVKPSLLNGLRNFQETQVCAVAIGLVGDIARALGKKLAPCDEIVQILLLHLQNNAVDRASKPAMISCLGDIALAIEGHFERYLPFVMIMLVQASSINVEANDEEGFEYINLLRESVVDAYTGIVQGLAADNLTNVLLPFVQSMVQFLNTLAEDNNKEEAVTEKAVALIGDIATCLRESAKPFLGHPCIGRLVQEAQNGSERCVEAATRTSPVVQKLLSL